MAEIMSLKERRAELLEVKLKKAREMVMDLDPADEDYPERLRETTAYLQSVNDDVKAKETLEFEEARQKDEKKSGLIRNILQGASIVVTCAIAVVTEVGRNKRFNRATEKESEEPILSLTDKTTVQEGLREREPKSIGFLKW